MMLAYAAQNPRPADRAGSPKALTVIIAGHAVLIAAVMTARMELAVPPPQGPTVLVDIFDPPPPPEPTVEPQPTRPATQPTFIENQPPIVDMDQPTPFELDRGPTLADIGKVIGSGPTMVLDPPKHETVKTAAVSRTPDSALRPPYPNDKLRLGEEAALKLKLTIDAQGRVTAVEPVGPADPSFLAAARRHILKSWRYKPATEDGVAVPTTTVINLSFRVEQG